jgi:signal transduction histidine kinase
MIIQSEKMMSVGGLAAGMAHEINNPLAGIMQNAQVIKNRLTSSIPANDKAALESETTMNSVTKYMKKRKILSSLDNILDASSNAAKIVDNMLSFARKGDSSKAKCNIAQLLEKTLELAQSDYNLKKKYDFKQVGIIKEFDPDIPDVLCEESKIMQVFFNIIKNATESMYEVKGKTNNPNFTFRLQNLKKMVQIEIEDNGPGMDKDVRKRAFEPFFTTKNIKKGTGLGLSLSYFIIVEDHQGEMEVESVIGKGSKFIIRLPFS